MNPFAALARLLTAPPAGRSDVQAALSHVAITLRELGTAGKLAAADPSFARKLEAPVAIALDYCDALVASVPGLVDIDRSAFASNPLVHALFASPTDIDLMLGRSMQLRDYLASAPALSGDYLYSLLAMRRQEKSTLGMELDGNALRADVPQHLLYFTDHTLVELGDDLDTTRGKLRLDAFDSLMSSFAEHFKAIANEQQSLRNTRAFENAHLAVMRGQEGGQEYVVHTRKVTELDDRLRAVAEILQPGPMLDALASFLSQPESSLRLEPVEVCVDRSGVILTGAAAAKGTADTIGFPELVARDRRRHVVVLSRFLREDAQKAVAAIRDQQARFVVI